MAQSYDIFMSYRHKPLDEEITRRSFNFLERYSLPKSLKESGCRTVQRVFRDTEELPVSRILTHTINEALRSADFLVVVCSTATPESEWIDREIMTFTEMGKAESVYPLLIAGSPEESFPRSLKAIPDIEDRVMDVRCEGNKADAIMKKAEKALLRVVAAVAGCSEEKLRKEQSMRSSKRGLTAGLTAVAVFAAVMAVSAGLMKLAENYRTEARHSQDVSMTVLQELTYGLPDKLSDIPGTYSSLSGILAENAEKITEILELSGSDPSVRHEIGVNYERLSSAYRTIGRYDAAEEAIKNALAEYESIDPGSADVASACSNLGSILNASGRYSEAGEYYDRAASLLSAIPGNNAMLAQIIANSGTNLLSAGKTEEGVAALSKAFEMASPEEWPDVETVAFLYYQYGKGLRSLMRYDEAETVLINSDALFSDIVNPSRRVRSEHILACAEYAYILIDTGRYAEAADIYGRILPEAEELAQDSENADFLSELAKIYNNYAVALNLLGRLDDADEIYIKAADIYGRLCGLTGADTDRSNYAIACINIADNSFTAGNYDVSREWFERGLEEYDTVAEKLGDYHYSTYLSYRGFYKLTFLNDPEGTLNDTQEAYTRYGSVLTYAYYALACMFSGDTDTADQLFSILAENGAGGHIRQLITAVRDFGLENGHMDYVLENFT